MREAYSLVWSVLVFLFRSRVSLEAEILILRHQLNIQRRHVPKRVAFSVIDRLIFVGLYRLVPTTIKALTIESPIPSSVGTVPASDRIGAGNPGSLRPPDCSVASSRHGPTTFGLVKSAYWCCGTNRWSAAGASGLNVRYASGGRGTCTCGIRSRAGDVLGCGTWPRTSNRRPASATSSGYGASWVAAIHDHSRRCRRVGQAAARLVMNGWWRRSTPRKASWSSTCRR